MKNVILLPIGENAPPVNNRYAWEHVYGGSHYLYNKHNTSLASVARLSVHQLPDELCKKLLESGFQKRLPVDYEHTGGWKAPSAPLPKHILEAEHVHFDPEESSAFVYPLAEKSRVFAQQHYRCFLKAVKVRLVRLSKGFVGDWHKDNFPTGIVKVLIYLSGCDEASGTTQIRFEGEDDIFVSGPPGTVALFDTNQVIHRALGPKLEREKAPQYRYSMEVTFVPCEEDQKTVFIPKSSLISTWPYPDESAKAFANLAASIIAGGGRKPSDPHEVNHVLRKNYQQSPKALNIGGGAQFLQPGWANIDGAFGETNPNPVKFNARTTFGFPDGAFAFIYTSHTLEHLDTLTCARIVSEATRVLEQNGCLLVKVPDLESFIAQSRSGQVSASLLRCLCGVQRTWSVFGVSFSFWQAISFLACSAWNSAYSDDIFNDSTALEKPGRYFGPCPDLSDRYLRNLFEEFTPGEAATVLRRKFLNFQRESNQSWTWGHQSAWSTVELNDLFKDFGYELISNNRDSIISRIEPTPTFFRSQWDLTLWGLYTKRYLIGNK